MWKKSFLSLLFSLMVQPVLAGISEWVQSDNSEGSILIPIEINKVKTRAMLDTGAGTYSISESFLEKYGQEFPRAGKVRLKGVISEQKKTLVNRVPISLFNVDFTLDKLVPLPLTRADLIIGNDFFANFIVQIDYPNKRLRIMTRDAVDLKKYANLKARQSKDGLELLVRVTINDSEGLWLLFDTGNNGGMLVKRDLAESRGWLADVQTRQHVTVGVNALARMESFNVDKLKIGPFELENAIMTIPAQGAYTQIGEDFATDYAYSKISRGRKSDGVLGYDILKHFIVTIDYRKKLINLSLPKES